jgi:arabinogalactan oligomer/maltooligosaccharide transport system substrate-binding protein
MFSNKSRWVAAALATVMSAGVLAGVAPANAATKTLVIWADESRGPILKSLLFGKTPVAGYKITVKAFSSLGALDTAFAAATRATGPDIVFSNAGLAAVGGKSGKLQPLNLPASVRSQFGAKSFQALSYNSKVYGLPIDVDTTALFWNKAKFGKKAPTTLPQMVAHYKNNKVSKGYTAGICIPDSVWGAQSLITAMGGSAWNYDSKGNPLPNTTKINSAAFKANFTSLFMTNGESNGFYKEGGCFNDFLDGKIPFANTGGWNYSGMESANLNVGVAQLPGMTAGKFGSPWTGYQAVYVTKFAGQNGKGAGAMSFAVRYMSSANVQAALGSASDRPPANLAAAKLLRNPITLGLAKAGSGGVLQLSAMLDNTTAGSNWYALVPGAFNDILVDGDPVGTTLDTLATKVKQNFVAGAAAAGID